MKQVESLKEIAIEASFRDVVSLLSKIGTTFRSYQEKIKFAKGIRQKLDDYLVGVYAPYRHKLWHIYLSKSLTSNIPHPYLFFSHILDKTFITFELPLQTCLRLQSQISITKLVETIAALSPLLHNFTLSHNYCQVKPDVEVSLAKSFSLFKKLTQLRLGFKLSDNAGVLFYSQLSKSCPNVKLLQLNEGITFEPQHILALVLGSEWLDMIPTSVKEKMKGPSSNIHHIHFASEYTNPICKTLEQLAVFHKPSNNVEEYVASLAFLLRHLPLLKELDIKSAVHCCCRAVQLLYEAHQLNAVLVESEVSWHQTPGPLRQIQWTTNSPPPQTLNLVKMEGVNLASQEMVNAIVSMCPHLKTVEFTLLPVNPGDTIIASDEQLQALLSNRFTEVVNVVLDRLPGDYCETVVACLPQQQLTSIKFGLCSEIDLTQLLLPCSRLEELEIGKDCQMMMTPTALEPGDVFLPNLKNLRVTSCCLGQGSSLFETARPLLNRVELNCVHFDIQEVGDHRWDLPDLWPNLEYLMLHRVQGLTAAKLIHILSRLTRLKVARLPKDVLQPIEQKLLVTRFQFLKFSNGNSSTECSYQLQVEEEQQ